MNSQETEKLKEEFDNLIRDLTSSGYKSKSEVRNRIKDFFFALMNLLREDLARLEHVQWEHWTKYLAKEWPNLPKELKDRWKKNWKFYSQLTEKEKDKDRIWADKIIVKVKNIFRSLKI